MRTTMLQPAGVTALLLLAALLGACASTSLVNQWKSPDYSGGPVRKVMVVGVAKSPSTRRVFEDEFAAKLKAAGVEAIPSYTQLGQEDPADPAVIESIVKKLGADGVLITRLVKQEQQTEVSGYYGPVTPMGFNGWYSSAWMGYYEAPTVYQYDVVILETSLYSVPQSKLIWSGSTETFSPVDVKKETAGFADIIIGALRKQGVI